MTRDFQAKNKTNISAQVSLTEYKKIDRYCRKNNIKLSVLIRQAVSREMQTSPAFEIMAEVEKLIDSKIEEKMKIIDISAKKIN